MRNSYDFGGWVTRNNLRCSDGRTIRKDAFKNCDGQTVPLVWNHEHNDSQNVLGHCLLENRDEGVYGYATFNKTQRGQDAKEMVQHGDIVSLSIYANKLKQNHGDVLHGSIREVSLVLAGANPGAYIDDVIVHGDFIDDEAVISTGYYIDEYFEHAEEKEEEDMNEDETIQDVFDTLTEKQKTAVYAIIGNALEDGGEMSHAEDDIDEDETIQDVFDTLSEKQKTAVYAIIGNAIEDEEGEEEDMKHNVFENDFETEDVLCHADQMDIISAARRTGSLRAGIEDWADGDDELMHSFDSIESLFPEYEDVRKGAPELLTRDLTWIEKVMGAVHKSPISRIRTKHIDARTLRGAKGYKTKGEKKKEMENIALSKRTTDPQTVYVKDKLNRDDIIDITDFSVVDYLYGIMDDQLREEIARAILVGDGREDMDEDKISPEHIRPIWQDDDLYTIHTDIDVAKAKKELQGTNTDLYFGDNFVYAEAVITAALYSREKYKGSGTPTFYCAPHLVNVMLLARDRDGRRIYNTVAELTAALNVKEIVTIEQFEGLQRENKQHQQKKLLGLFVNLADYSLGSTKGGEISRFNQFDIDFNQEKYLIETRCSGALTKIYSAIALEEPVALEASASEETL